MPLQDIPIGTSPDDGTGITNREAWKRLNEMLVELYASVGASVTHGEYDAQVAVLVSDIATVAAGLALKADATALQAKAEVAEVILTSALQTLTLAQKKLGLSNAGGLSVLPFEILPANVSLLGEWLFTLPRPPRNFSVYDTFFTIHDFNTPLTAGVVEITATLTQTAAAGSVTAVDFDANGVAPFVVSAAENLLLREVMNLSATVTSSDPYNVADPKGLTLWFRGVWQS